MKFKKFLLSLIIGILFAGSMSSCWLECLDSEVTYRIGLTNWTDGELYLTVTNDTSDVQNCYIRPVSRLGGCIETFYTDDYWYGPDILKKLYGPYLILLYPDSSIAAIWDMKHPESQPNNRWLDTAAWTTEVFTDSVPNCTGKYHTEYKHTFAIVQSDLRRRSTAGNGEGGDADAEGGDGL